MTPTNLPIDIYVEDILQSVRSQQVTLIVGETGSGKSTRVPHMLIDNGYTCLVTQPRRLSTITVATRVADENDEVLGQRIGYATRYEKLYTPETECLFCTDGLGVVRTLMGTNKFTVLVIDEIHEFNLNQEILLGWAKHQMQINPNFRMILMSATVNVGEFIRFFGDMLNIMQVEGRTFPVTDISEQFDSYLGQDLEAEVINTFVRKGKNCLVFLPGKKEIANLKETLEKMRVSAVVVELHGELQFTEQQKAFNAYSLPKVVLSTNVAQTAVTIPDINVVIDTEMERRIEINNSVEGLFLRRISKADVNQRMGRAGRVQHGEYVSVYRENEKQDDFPIPEIQRLYLDHVYLKVCAAGLDPEHLEFLHAPNAIALKDAYHLLCLLDCITLDRKLTPLGSKLVRYPVSVRYAKMLHTAASLGVFEPVLQVVCCLNTGIRFKGVSSDCESDLELYANFLTHIQGKKEMVLKEEGIHWKAIKIFKELYMKCYEGQYSTDNSNYWPYWDKIKDSVEISVLSGMLDCIWTRGSSALMFQSAPGVVSGYQSTWKVITNPDGEVPTGVARDINRHAIMVTRLCTTVAGYPVDIRFKDRYERECELNILTFVLPFKEAWLEWFPQFFYRGIRVEEQAGRPTLCHFWGIQYDGRFIPVRNSGETHPIGEDLLPTSVELAKVFYTNLQSRITQIEMGEEQHFEVSVPLLRDIERITKEQLIGRAAGRNVTIYNPFNPEEILYAPPKFTFVEFSRDTSGDPFLREIKQRLLEREQRRQKMIGLEKPKPQLWKSSRGKVICPNGHEMKMSKALSADPTCLTCPTCKVTGSIAGIGG